MPKSDNQKAKILYIAQYLEQNSNADHPIRATELMEMLQKHDISCERKTIYSDIRTLQDFGMDIVSLPGKNGGYYLASRIFDLPELKLLIDAVSSSRYLSEKKTGELIEKLCRQCSLHDARLMRRNITVSGRVKNMNESILVNVDYIQEAIYTNRQITFLYFDWDIHGQRQYRNREYEASPYGLCQDNENCYLLAWTQRHGVTTYRVDRMASIHISDIPRIPCPELTGAAFRQRANRLFQMYDGETLNVKLRFHKDLANVVVDRFGRDTMMIPDGDGTYFTFVVPVALSPMFLSWVIGFGEKAKILHPESAVNACRALCQQALNQYQASENEAKI